MTDVCFQCNDSMCSKLNTIYDHGDQNTSLLVPGLIQQCTSNPDTSPGKCTMCRFDKWYYVWCRNVSASFQPALEANSTAITNYEQANCTVIGIAPNTVNGSDFTGAGDQYGHPGDELWWVLLIPVLVVCIGIAYWCIKKRNRSRNYVI